MDEPGATSESTSHFQDAALITTSMGTVARRAGEKKELAYSVETKIMASNVTGLRCSVTVVKLTRHLRKIVFTTSWSKLQ